MKKIISSFIAFIMIISLVLSISSCVAIPKLDLKHAERALKEENYYVSYIDDAEDLDAGEIENFTATSRDGKDHLYVVRYETTKLAKLNYEVIKLERQNSIDATKKEIKIIEYTLKKFDKDLSRTEYNELNDRLEDLYDALDTLQKDLSIGINGKYVWVGTKNAIKDSKG